MYRENLKIIFYLLFILSSINSVLGDQKIIDVRVWPAPDYTRITIESSERIKYNSFTLNNPSRLVIDLNNIKKNNNLKKIKEIIKKNDSIILGARTGQYKKNIFRIVMDLKKEIDFESFYLNPVSDYGFRLVIDLFPKEKEDKILNIINKKEDKSLQSKDNRKIILKKNIVIAIDAGHGGEDPGAVSKKGTHEKDITLSIAKILKKIINKQENMSGKLIRKGDYFLSLGRRVELARKMKADVFISIHADAFNKPRARGSSVFALSTKGASSAAARWLAKKENEADLIGGINIDVKDKTLKRVLIDLSQTASIKASMKLGKNILKEISKINRLHKKKVEQAAFAVLKAPDIPSVLVETAFLTNPYEEKKLKQPKYQIKMANAIMEGIQKYFDENPLFAPEKKL